MNNRDSITIQQLHELLKTWSSLESGQPPLFIQGKPGIGKSSIVESFARQQNLSFAYLAPAQYEEMGDLLGMPYEQNGKTHYAQPEWAPEGTGPGILLIDDVNRADERILKGLMPFIERGVLGTYQLPSNWQIVLTGNEPQGDQFVTPMDTAFIGRTLPVVLRFDLDYWFAWAEDSGIDAGFFTWVSQIEADLQTGALQPRQLTYFLKALQKVDRSADWVKWSQILGHQLLPANVLLGFQQFIQNPQWVRELETSLNTLSPTELRDQMAALEPAIRLNLFKEMIRLGRLEKRWQVRWNETMLTLLQSDQFASDQRFYLARGLANANNPELLPIFQDAEVIKLIG